MGESSHEIDDITSARELEMEFITRFFSKDYTVFFQKTQYNLSKIFLPLSKGLSKFGQ